MARRSRNGVLEFLQGFNGVYGTTKNLISNIENSKIADAKPEEVVGEDGTTTYKMLGKTYDTAPTDAQQNYARNMATAGTAKKWGEAGKGMPMEAMANKQKSHDNKTA